MMNNSMLLIPAIFVPVMLIFINFLISTKSFKDREKMSPFECGFDPLSQNRMLFSIHSFWISLIFLIFDVETTILIPLISMMTNYSKTLILTAIMFILILLIGTSNIEYMEYSIDWKI